MNDDEPEVCVVCRRHPPENGTVCESDRARIAEQLHDLIGQVHRLEFAVAPSSRRGDGVRVTTSKGNAPLPARLDALSLLGPGAEQVTAMMHPRVQHWKTTREADVTFVQRTLVQRGDDGPWVPHAEVVTERRTITEWHRAVMLDDAGDTVVAADDDQIGVLPPQEWLASWVQFFQDVFRGRVVRRARETSWLHQRMLRNTRAKTELSATETVAAITALASNPTTAANIAAIKAIGDQYRQALVDTVTGRTLGHTGDTSRWARSDDPLEDDMLARFWPTPASAKVADAVAYLLLWLDEACDEPAAPVSDFAGELRSLSAELSRVLGEQPDQMWLGRCPARITNPATAVTAPCGAGIWQDPHASQVQCPRCHCTWGPRRVELLHLATEMRRTWPVDRRRLYTAEEAQTVRRPRCPKCGALAGIEWRDVTGTGDHVQVFQPVGATCPTGCDEAKQVI